MKGSKYFSVFVCVGVLLILVQACNMPNGVPPTPVDMNTNATLASLVSTQTAMAGAIAEGIVPVIMVSTDTDCRSGPGEGYDILMTLPAGESAEVVGKYTSLEPAYWIIQKDSTICWLWGQSVVLEGDISGLPEMPVPALSVAASGLSSATPVPSVVNPPTVITVTPTSIPHLIATVPTPTSIPHLIATVPAPTSIPHLIATVPAPTSIPHLIADTPTNIPYLIFEPTIDTGFIIDFLPTDTPSP